jgi:lipocalin-like protein
MHRSKAFAIAIATILVAAGGARAEDLASSVIGSWRLISCKVERSDGSVQDLYGPSPLGLLMYDRSGHMSVHLLKPNLPKCGTQDRRKCPDAQARIAFDNYGGYWGRYEVRPSDKVVFHHVEGASAPDWVGTSQKRFVEISGKRLTITTPPQQVGGVGSVVVLVWERVD